MRIDTSKKIVWINICFLIQQMKIKNYIKHKNIKILQKYNDVFNRIRKKIKKINSNECYYEKDYMKIKFNSDDDLPLYKSLKFSLMTITIRCVFEENGKLYPQVFLDDTFR